MENYILLLKDLSNHIIMKNNEILMGVFIAQFRATKAVCTFNLQLDLDRQQLSRSKYKINNYNFVVQHPSDQ